MAPHLIQVLLKPSTQGLPGSLSKTALWGVPTVAEQVTNPTSIREDGGFDPWPPQAKDPALL